ncbi:hypothetical protein BGZ74_003230, partial [Mortierella antarctica]
TTSTMTLLNVTPSESRAASFTAWRSCSDTKTLCRQPISAHSLSSLVGVTDVRISSVTTYASNTFTGPPVPNLWTVLFSRTFNKRSIPSP